MNLRILIALLSIIRVSLIALLPCIGDTQIPMVSNPADSSTVASVPATSEYTPPTTHPATQPPTQPPTTHPSTQLPTQLPSQPPVQVPVVPQGPYSDNPVVDAFIEERMSCWTCPIKDGFGDVTGSRRFATSRDSGKRAHAGLDFVAPHGTKVYAITSGTVQRVALFYQSTWSVEVKNDDGSVLRYCEIATDLQVGDRVEQGDIIATIMRADGGTEMLHMEVYYGNATGRLTQPDNWSYTYVSCSKLFARRCDLIDPTFLKDLPVN